MSSTGRDTSGIGLRNDIDRMARERAQDRARIAELAEVVENLQAEIDVLKDRAPSPSEKQYEQMSKADKAQVVRSKLKEEAKSRGGKAAVQYNDVIRMFDGRPSTGHAYDIIKTAAEAKGYDYNESPEGKKRLTVNLDKTEV